MAAAFDIASCAVMALAIGAGIAAAVWGVLRK